jgi:hypothetical protein
LREGLQAARQQLDEYEANGGHKSPYIPPVVTGSLDHEMMPSHSSHPLNDKTFLDWARRTNVRNLSQEKNSSRRELREDLGSRELSENPQWIGELVRMDVGELLSSRTATHKDRGKVQVVGGDKILYEQPDGTWITGYVSGIWRTHSGSFFYEVRETVKTSWGKTLIDSNTDYTWRTIGGIQLLMSPEWSRPTNKVAMEALTVPVERKTAGQKRTHDQRVNEAAMKAERKSILEKTRKQFCHSSERGSETLKEKETRMLRIRLAQMQAFEEKCNLQFLELTKERVNKEVGRTSEKSSHRSLGTLAKSPVIDAKWCKFHKEWGFHTEETCNWNPNSSNYNRGYKKGYSSMQ